jgi:hypothetical protein
MIYRLTLDVTCPVLTTTNELYVIDTTNSKPGSTLLVEETKDYYLLDGFSEVEL